MFCGIIRNIPFTFIPIYIYNLPNLDWSLSKDVSIALVGDPGQVQKRNIPSILTRQFKLSIIKYM